jgi:hypothetical protein
MTGIMRLGSEEGYAFDIVRFLESVRWWQRCNVFLNDGVFRGGCSLLDT